MLHYKSRNENNSNQVYIPECCPQQPTPNTPEGCDCSFDSWTRDLKITTNLFNEWNAKVDKRQKHYDVKFNWRNKLKTWYDDLESADENAEKILNQIEIFISHLNKTCRITQKSVKAIEILFCMIEDIYTRVDNLKTAYDSLINCITAEGRTKAELAPGTGIIICLTEYGKKLDAVIATRDVLIQLMSTVIEQAYKLHEYLCLNERHCGEEKIDYGLINILNFWKNIFNGSIVNNHGDCKFNPCISFPIDQSEYYTKIKRDWEKSKTETSELSRELDDAKERRAAYLASKESLTNALREAGPDVKCK